MYQNFLMSVPIKQYMILTIHSSFINWFTIVISFFQIFQMTLRFSKIVAQQTGIVRDRKPNSNLSLTRKDSSQTKWLISVKFTMTL